MDGRIEKGKESIIEKLDLPKDVMLDLPKIEILGDREITIENHKGIALFERNMIKINTKTNPIEIKGQEFEIVFIGASTITVKGKFNSIKYEGAE
ncbi:MAG: sporulation protein YqfC [Clostridium sp.]